MATTPMSLAKLCLYERLPKGRPSLSVAEKVAATGALWTQLDAAVVANAKPMALVVALGVLSRPSETGS